MKTKKKINKEVGKEGIVERLQEMTQVLQKVAMGDFSARVDIPKKEDKFTEFAVTLNTMIEDLGYSASVRKKAETELKEKVGELGKIKEGLEETVTERTKELQEKVDELERFNKIAVGRELKMIELKQEIARLEKELAHPKNQN